MYDPVLRTWTTITPEMNTARFWYTATLLLSGKVLVAGGGHQDKGDVSSTELFDEAPAAPQVTNPAPDERFLDTWTPDITGTAEPYSTVKLSLDQMDTVSVLVDRDGAWSYTPEAPLGIGPHTLSAWATDRVGNVSDEASVAFQMLARSHYDSGCSSTAAFPVTGIILLVLGVLHRKGRRAHFHS